MACRKLSRRHATRLMMGAACATTFALTACAASGQARGIDWNAVGRAIGQPLKTEAQDVHTAEWLRTDLHVVNAGVHENPGMELNAEASFHQTSSGKAVMIGEVTLTSAEVNTVTDRLQHGGVQVTALHKHLQDDTTVVVDALRRLRRPRRHRPHRPHRPHGDRHPPQPERKEQGTSHRPGHRDAGPHHRHQGRQRERRPAIPRPGRPEGHRQPRPHHAAVPDGDLQPGDVPATRRRTRRRQRRLRHDRGSGKPGDQSPTLSRPDHHRGAQPHAVRPACSTCTFGRQARPPHLPAQCAPAWIRSTRLEAEPTARTSRPRPAAEVFTDQLRQRGAVLGERRPPRLGRGVHPPPSPLHSPAPQTSTTPRPPAGAAWDTWDTRCRG